MKAIKR